MARLPDGYRDPVTVLTMNSEEVVIALASANRPTRSTPDDVFKIDIARRLGKQLIAEIP